MAATNYDFSIEQGTIFGIDFSYKTNSNQTIDMSNYCCILRIQPSNATSDGLITYSTTGTNVTTSYAFVLYPELGKISLRLPAETTNSFSWDSAIYELEVTSPDLLYTGSSRIVKRLLKGTITLLKRSIPATDLPSCFITDDADQIVTNLPTSSFGIYDSCIGSPCEFIGGNANIYSFVNNNTDQTIMYLRDRSVIDQNSFGTSSPFPFTLSVTESKTLERIDVFIDGFTHTAPQDVRLLLTHNGSGVLLLDQNKFASYNNKPKNLSFVLSDYATLRPDGANPTVNNVIDYNYSLLSNKNLGAALPGTQNAISLYNTFPSGAFNVADSNKDIVIYGSGLKTFEGMDTFGDWKLYALDYNEGDSGSIQAVKLIMYFQNEQSNDPNNSGVCGLLPRDITIIGTAVTVEGDLTSELSENDIIMIEYSNSYGVTATSRSISSQPSYSTGSGNTTFSIDNSIPDMINNDAKIIKYTFIG
jgi:subtilisin-like proprotein convertase family protein